tara:strand:+ start:36289 stop:36639 length:351 start_codon:yes stop_codon:yes gene_type:complete
MVFITSLSLFSLSSLGNYTHAIVIPHLDKVVHFTFYFVATISGSFFLREIKEYSINLLQASNKMFLFSIGYGMIIEVLQYSITENRHGDFFDFIANSLGAFTGWLVIKYMISNRVA